MASSRRDFLKGRAAVDAISQIGASQTLGADDGLSDNSLIDPAAGDSYLMRLSRRAMACEFEVVLNVGQYPAGSAAALAALDLIDQLEQQLTVYRDDSEISLLNAAAAAAGPVEVEAQLFALLQQAVQLYRDTGHAYDITSGPLSKLWGFYRRAGRVPESDELAAALQKVGSDKMVLNSEQRTVQFLQSGVELNLGSIGKGYALDRAAQRMQQFEVRDFLLHGGLSSILAAGSRGNSTQAATVANDNDTPTANAGWWIGLRHPLRPQQRLAEVRVVDRALATSGSAVQFFVQNGRRYGHILDPRTGWPAEGTLSTTVLAPTAAEADALSTALYVMDHAAAIAYCQTRPEIGLVQIAPAARSHAIAITVVGISKDDIRWLDAVDADIEFLEKAPLHGRSES